MSRATFESDYEFGEYEDDDYRGFEIRDDESNRGPLILALALGILIVFGAVVWNTYKQGVRSTGTDLPVIASTDTPYKRVPADQGGATTPDLDARIYDQIDGASRPLAPHAAADTSQPNETPPEVALEGGPAAGADADPIVLGQFRKLEGLRGGVDTEDAPEVASLTPAAPSNSPVPLDEVNVERPVSVTASEAQFEFISDGTFLVQISALRSRDAAEKAWSIATRKSPDLFKGSEKRIQRADLGAKGVFYRLRVGSFSERDAASEFCNALKSAKHQCIVVQN